VIGGVAGGIVIASLAVPLLLTFGLSRAWLGIAVLIALLWLLARPHWPKPPPAPRPGEAPRLKPERLLVLAYALSGGGLVAPMVYLADLAARGHGLGIGFGAMAWLLFGAGGLVGTLAGGAAADRFGGGRAMVAWLGLQVLSLGLLLLPSTTALVLGATLSGFVGVGVSTVVLAVARERAGVQAGRIWVRVTAGFAVTQAATGFGLAALFAMTGESHLAVFGACLALSLASLAAGLADQRIARGAAI
jgi:predicted MFS family arabinose efflux permease